MFSVRISPPSSNLYRCVECSLAHFHSILHIYEFSHVSVGSASGVSGEARGRRAPPPLRGGFPPASQVLTLSCMAYAVDVGHFTHFAFTVIFTHYVKTKPDSGFTVKSRTLEREDVRAQSVRELRPAHILIAVRS